ncbi:hypothetical protein HMPREF9701_02048 [Delftia acidovorans CCUG 274B]|nr:hypothetical protein HMPREF9701_02048 [Delftia acidovorans CCUG 274B]
MGAAPEADAVQGEEDRASAYAGRPAARVSHLSGEAAQRLRGN